MCTFMRQGCSSKSNASFRLHQFEARTRVRVKTPAVDERDIWDNDDNYPCWGNED